MILWYTSEARAIKYNALKYYTNEFTHKMNNCKIPAFFQSQYESFYEFIYDEKLLFRIKQSTHFVWFRVFYEQQHKNTIGRIKKCIRNAVELCSNSWFFLHYMHIHTHTRSRCIVFKPKSQHHTPKLIHSFKGFVPKFTCMTRKIPFCSVFIGKTKKSFDDLIYNLLVISIDLNKN